MSPPHLPFSHPHALPPNLLSARRPPRSGDQAKAAAAAGGMTPKSRSLMADADQDDPLVQQFRKADLNKDGKLSQYEIKQMMITQLGYEADEAYVASLLEEFGDYDLDSDGAISLDEFEALFNHLGGMKRVNAVSPQAAEHNVRAGGTDLPEAPASSLSARFSGFDSDQKGWLAPDDVKAVLAALAYEHDDAYVQNLMETFAQFDEDGDGKLQENEFDHLWEHLGGDERFEAAELERSQAESADLSPDHKPFVKYASSSNGTLVAADVQRLLADLGFVSDALQAKSLVTRFGHADAIDSNGFAQLWAHLGSVGSSGLDKTTKSSEVPSQHYLADIYQRFDVNGGGLRCAGSSCPLGLEPN